MENKLDSVLFSEGTLQGIVAVEPHDVVEVVTLKFRLFALIGDHRFLSDEAGCHIQELSGALPYKWQAEYNKFKEHYLRGNYFISERESFSDLSRIKGIYHLHLVEQFLVQSGETFFNVCTGFVSEGNSYV